MRDRPRSRGEADSGDERARSASVRVAPADTDGVASTEAYDVDDGTVFFDVQNPLAWVETDDAVALERMV